MRDAPGEDRERFQLLRLEECVARALALGDVPASDQDSADSLVLHADGAVGDVIPAGSAVGEGGEALEVDRFARDGCIEVLVVGGAPGARHMMAPELARDIDVAIGGAKVSRSCGVHAKDAPFGVQQHKAVAGTGKDRVQVGCALTGHGLGAELFGHIGGGTCHPDDAAFRVAKRKRRDDDVQDMTVPVPALGARSDERLSLVHLFEARGRPRCGVSALRVNEFDRLAEDFGGRIAIGTLSAAVPVGDAALEVKAQDGIGSRLDDAGETLRALAGQALFPLETEPFGNVPGGANDAVAATLSIEERRQARLDLRPGAVRHGLFVLDGRARSNRVAVVADGSSAYFRVSKHPLHRTTLDAVGPKTREPAEG